MKKSRYSRIKDKAGALSVKFEELQRSASYIRVVGILSGLGFLIAPGVTPMPRAKVDLEEALAVGQIEPRILEVLPAAVLSYPASFLHMENAPSAFMEVVDALKYNRVGPSLGPIGFDKFYEAANRATKSRKRKTVMQRRIPKTFRLSQDAIRVMSKRACENKISQTQLLERLILGQESMGRN